MKQASWTTDSHQCVKCFHMDLASLHSHPETQIFGSKGEHLDIAFDRIPGDVPGQHFHLISRWS